MALKTEIPILAGLLVLIMLCVNDAQGGGLPKDRVSLGLNTGLNLFYNACINFIQLYVLEENNNTT